MFGWRMFDPRVAFAFRWLRLASMNLSGGRLRLIIGSAMNLYLRRPKTQAGSQYIQSYLIRHQWLWDVTVPR